MAVRPVDLETYYSRSGDIYEAIAIMAKRARQIHQEIRIELNQRLELIQQLQTTTDPEEEVNGGPNPDQLRISAEFEQRPKATEVALEEFSGDQLTWRQKSTEEGGVASE